MRSPSSQYSMLFGRSTRLPLLLALVAPLAFGACADSDTPLEPADTPSAGELASPDLALVTTGQRILFSSSRKGTFDLFKSDPQGANLVHLTSFAKYETEAAWSWDNKRIAMVRPRLDANNVEHPDIYLMNADGTGKRWALPQPTSIAMRYPAWSPDGTHLLVTLYLFGGPFLATLKPSTGELAYVLADGEVVQGSDASYDATGEYILYMSPIGPTVNWIWNGRKYGVITSTAQSPITSSAFSPDGRKIAFTRVVSGNADIYVWTLGIGTIKRLTTHASYDGLPTWSPDGSRIAFESARSGQSQIWTMNASTGGGLTRITHTSTGETDPAWSH
jgi:Tol biopolymer transport system component